MATTDILFTWTKDNLQLQGVHFPSASKDLCVLFVHGMAGNYVDNYFGHVLGSSLQKRGIGFVFSHNRGCFHTNDLALRDPKTGEQSFVRMGATYERFEGCVLDIESWLEKARALGYKQFVIVGHSLGGPKVVHHFFATHPKDVVGMVLSSTADMVGLVKIPEGQPDYVELLVEAKDAVSKGQPRKILSGKIWDWYEISAQTFLDLFEEGSPADVLPILRNPDVFPELASIDVPILCIMGEHDDVVIRALEKDMEVLKEKATKCPNFTTCLLPGANHVYEGKEEEYAQQITNWIKGL